MREFASPAARAATLPRPIKVLYTAFCAFVAAGLLSCVGLYDGIVEFGVRTTPAQLYDRLIGYYHRGPAAHGSFAAEPSSSTAARTAARAPMSRRKLLEVTHFHLFSVPLFLLVVGHLFLLCGLSARAKTGWIAAAVALTALHLFAPWGVYLAGSALAWLYPLTGAGMLLSFAVLMGVPVYEMWAPR